MCVLSETHLITYRNSCSSLLSRTHVSNSPSWHSLSKLHASKALLCFGVIYMGVAQSSVCGYLTSADSSIPREVLEAELYPPLLPPYSHHGQPKLFFSRTWSNHIATATPAAFTPKSLQVTALIKVSAIESICNHITAGVPQYFRYTWNATKTHLYTDAFSKTSLHTPHTHRSEAWGLGLLQPSKREISLIPNTKVSIINIIEKNYQSHHLSPSNACRGKAILNIQ